jgi:hypothetical protein
MCVFTQPVPRKEAGFSILKMRFITVVTLLFLSLFLSISASAATLVVDDNATECPAAGFTTIQAAINAAAPTDTIQVCAGTYAEQININKPLTLLGPNTGIDPNVGPRVAEAVIIPTASDPINPAFAGPIVVTMGVSGITFRGFTVDGDNPALASGVVYNGADVNAEFGIYGTETANPDAVIINNIVKNIGEISIFISSNSQGGAKNANSQVSNNRVDNNLGNFGEGIRISDDAWVSVMNNYVLRLRIGIVIENYSGNTTTHPASVISGNNISAFRIGIWHNLHYVYTAPGFTISQNTVTAYVQSPIPPQVTTPISYQGIRVESIQQTVFVDVNDNILNGNRTALAGAGYTRDEGLNVTNASTTSPNIAFRRNNVSDFIRGVFHQTPAVPLFESNAITGSTFGIVNDAAATSGLIAHFNRIVGNTTAGLQNNAGVTINAENNWWGCNYGPGATGPGCSGTANAVGGPVDADPWLTLTTSAAPPSINIGATSNVTSSLRINSAAADTSGSGTVIDGTPATFAGTNGTVAPPSGATTTGNVGTVFTATTLGPGSASTTIDGQTVSAPITVTAPCRNVTVPSGMTTPRNAAVSVPINVDSMTGMNAISFDFTFTYNSSTLTFTGIDQAATLSSGMTVTINNSTPGTILVSGFQANPLSGAGTLIKLNFNATGPIGSTSALSLPAFMFNEGSPCSVISNGSITIISGTVNGVVSYANSMTFKPVPNTTLTGTGSLPTVFTNSAFFIGAYSLSGFGPGPYTVTPSKSGDANGISGFDSGLIAQHVVNLITLNAIQLQAADVSQAAGVTSFDAGLIARYVVALPNSGITGSWIFNPASRSYPNVETNQVNQDYGAILMGEVSGDWVAPTSFAPFAPLTSGKDLSPQAIVTVTAPQHVTPAGLPFTVPVSTTDLSFATTGIDVISYQFILTYDNTKIQPQTPAVTVAGTISENRSVTVNQLTPGILTVVVFGADPMIGAGTLFNFKFNAVGSPGQISPLTWQNFQFNEGNPDDNAVNGQVRLTVLSSANASIGGRVLSAFGQPVSKARVTLTDVAGHSRSVISSSMGYYIFNDVEVGQTYFVAASSKRFRFNPMVVSVSGDLTELDLIANPSEGLSP